MAKDYSSLRNFIRDIPDWPIKGVLFRDITPLLKDADAFADAVDALCDGINVDDIDVVAGVEARGFIFGAAVARKLGVGFVPIRKAGKLPWQTESISYQLEYGTAKIEVHADAMKNGSRVLMIDDLLATGGTMAAACELIKKAGGEIADIVFLVELIDLKGRDKLLQYPLTSIIKL